MSTKRKTKNDVLLSNIEVIKNLLINLYTIPKQLAYISQNNKSNFSVSDTTYMKFLNEYLPKEYEQYKKNLYFKTRISKIKEVTQIYTIIEFQFYELNFTGFINGNTRLDLTVEDYKHFMIRYFKKL